MIGLYDTEFIGLKKSSCGVIFECAFLLLSMDLEEIDCYHWLVNYNLFDYDKSLWSTTLRYINRLGFYDRVITPLNNTGQELRNVQEEVSEICSFFGVEALYVKGNVPTDKVLIQKCDPRIPLFNLEEFKCPKFEGGYHRPEDEVRFFAQWIPKNIPDREKSIRHVKNYPTSCDHRLWMFKSEL